MCETQESAAELSLDSTNVHSMCLDNRIWRDRSRVKSQAFLVKLSLFHRENGFYDKSEAKQYPARPCMVQRWVARHGWRFANLKTPSFFSAVCCSSLRVDLGWAREKRPHSGTTNLQGGYIKYMTRCHHLEVHVKRLLGVHTVSHKSHLKLLKVSSYLPHSTIYCVIE